MKKVLILLSLLILFLGGISAQKKALLVIDIQDFYFPGGKMELKNPEKAAENAALLLESFRKQKEPVFYIRHNFEPGGTINSSVKPAADETVISKDEVNCFLGTNLHEKLKNSNIDTLVICGMQTHMCVEAAVRAGTDLGYKCILIEDACATRDLKYDNILIPASSVHYSTLATLKSYATVTTTALFLKKR